MYGMNVQADLLIEIEAFLAARRGQPDAMAETTFGRLAVNDGKFVRRLRDGCNMTLATIDRVRKFMRSQQGKPLTPNLPAIDAKPKPAPKRSRAPVKPSPKPKTSTRAEDATAARAIA